MASFFDDEIDGPEANGKQPFMRPKAQPAPATGKVGRPADPAPPAPIKAAPVGIEPGPPVLSESLAPAPAPMRQPPEMPADGAGVIDRVQIGGPKTGFLDRVSAAMQPAGDPVLGLPPTLARPAPGGPSLPFPPMRKPAMRRAPPPRRRLPGGGTPQTPQTY